MKLIMARCFGRYGFEDVELVDGEAERIVREWVAERLRANDDGNGLVIIGGHYLAPRAIEDFLLLTPRSGLMPDTPAPTALTIAGDVQDRLREDLDFPEDASGRYPRTLVRCADLRAALEVVIALQKTLAASGRGDDLPTT